MERYQKIIRTVIRVVQLAIFLYMAYTAYTIYEQGLTTGGTDTLFQNFQNFQNIAFLGAILGFSQFGLQFFAQRSFSTLCAEAGLDPLDNDTYTRSNKLTTSTVRVTPNTRNKASQTILSTELTSTTLDLTIQRQNALRTTAARATGKTEAETGDKTFDDRFWITGDDHDTILRILTPDLRQRILDYDKTIAPFELKNDTIQRTIDAIISERSTLDDTLNAQTQILEGLQRQAHSIQAQSIQAQPAQEHIHAQHDAFVSS